MASDRTSTVNGTTVVVTGGTRGIGRAVADAFARAGATVVVGARDADAVEETVAELEGHETTAAGIRTDVRDKFDLERLAETASRTGDERGIDVVVPAAGTHRGEPGGAPTDRESYAALDEHWRTNGRGVFATIREALPHLNENARVLVPAGAVARDATPGYGSYAISKATAEAVARGFAADTDYVVGCVDPGRDATGGTSGNARDLESVSQLFVWAATDADSTGLDGRVLERDA